MADLLAAIVAATRRTIESQRARVPVETLERRLDGRRRASMRFARAIRGHATSVIAECKRRSPSRGVLRIDYDPVAIAREYEAAGAAAISVLTEPCFFDGAIEHLGAVGAAVDRPLLRKDFIVDDYQLIEAAASGADAALLIVAALDDQSLRALLERARALDLDVLVEVHDASELQRALDAGASIVGVNNRNLRTLEVSLAVSEALAARMPKEVTAVAESGIRTAEDVRRVAAIGYHAVLVGERFMTLDSPGRGLRELVGAAALKTPC